MIYENPVIFKKLLRSDSKKKFYYKKHYQKYCFVNFTKIYIFKKKKKYIYIYI